MIISEPGCRINSLSAGHLLGLVGDGHINDRTLEYLLVNGGARAGRFYLLPKLHKRGCLGRPVISGCNTPTQKISAFGDHHLKPLVAAVPSYVKDTNDFLKKLPDISTLPSGAIMVTIDGVGLFIIYILRNTHQKAMS